VVTSVTTPSEGFSSRQALVEWMVTNIGNAPTSTALWHDRVYFSVDTVLDASDVNLGTTPNVSHLAPGESYASSLLVTIPEGAQGDYHFLVLTDSWNVVQELEGENDNVTAGDPTTVQLT